MENFIRDAACQYLKNLECSDDLLYPEPDVAFNAQLEHELVNVSSKLEVHHECEEISLGIRVVLQLKQRMV